MRAMEQHRHSGHLRKRLHHLRRLGKSLDTGRLAEASTWRPKGPVDCGLELGCVHVKLLC